MFDRIMENSMAIWLPLSAAYLVFLAGMIVKAIRHFRGPRRIPANRILPQQDYAASAPRRVAVESLARDWRPAGPIG